MKEGRLLRIGGYISGGILIVLGIVVIVLGVWGFSFTRRTTSRAKGITFGAATDPAVQEHAEQWAGEPVDTGSKALAQAEIMREHMLSGSGGLDVRADRQLPVGSGPERSGGDERRGRGREGRERLTYLEQCRNTAGVHRNGSRDRS